MTNKKSVAHVTWQCHTTLTMLKRKVRQYSGVDMWSEILMMRRRPWSTGNFYSKGLRGSQLSHKDEGFALSDHKQTYGHNSYFKYAHGSCWNIFLLDLQWYPVYGRYLISAH